MDIVAILEIAGSVPDLSQTIADITRLYKLSQAGKIDVAAMDKEGSLEPAVASATRILGLFDKLLKDPVQRPHAVALVASFL